ncbi:hypothetical protein [Acinetobacter sp. YH01009]|uniref:hypothetical protein n=1 Tax=Acinetobacter sp. YH01009 TaxID=2601025 RepID=UPI0015D1E512|nr:hypothetical protein [Acinetobacter sp. YH01009]
MVPKSHCADAYNHKLEVNITAKPEMWSWLLQDVNLNGKPHIAISSSDPWYYADFVTYLKLLNFRLENLNFSKLDIKDFDQIDWSFLKSNRYQNAEVFKDQNILLNKPDFLCHNSKVLSVDINTSESQVAQLVYDYYRRYIPFLYSFLKLIRIQQKLSLEIKLPILDMFFSNFGNVDTGEFKRTLPFDDGKLISMLIDRFTEYCILRSEKKFGRAISQLNDVIKGLAEYLKIITTVNYIDYELMHFLHTCFMGDRFEDYYNFFNTAEEEFLLNNLSWTYTKAFQLSGS